MIKQVNDSDQISRLVLRDYKSIADCDLDMGRLNVLIGANGAGKSNLIDFFHSRLARVAGASVRRELLPGLLMLVATPASDGANIACCSDWVSRSTSASPP